MNKTEQQQNNHEQQRKSNEEKQHTIQWCAACSLFARTFLPLEQFIFLLHVRGVLIERLLIDSAHLLEVCIRLLEQLHELLDVEPLVLVECLVWQRAQLADLLHAVVALAHVQTALRKKLVHALGVVGQMGSGSTLSGLIGHKRTRRKKEVEGESDSQHTTEREARMKIHACARIVH